MKALTLNGYDGLPSLRLDTCPDPTPGPGDVLIQVRAASVNPVDVRITRGYLRGRVDFALPHVLGRDCSGIVTAVGGSVTGFRTGDEVFAVADQKRWGTHAELVAIDVATVARKPKSLDHIAAASLPIAGLSALAGIVTTGKLKRGERVLIHGGAGGVGSFAIQLAKHIGAYVATTCGAANADYVRSLGADVVADYTTGDFAKGLEGYDLVFDVFGGDVRYKSFPVLRAGGRITHLNSPPMTQPAPRDDVTVLPAVVNYETSYLDQLTALVDGGAVRSTVTGIVAFADALKAYQQMSTGHTRGKVVLNMSQS